MAGTGGELGGLERGGQQIWLFIGIQRGGSENGIIGGQQGRKAAFFEATRRQTIRLNLRYI